MAYLGPSTSTMWQSSIPMLFSAERTCSTVETRAWPIAREGGEPGVDHQVVARRDLDAQVHADEGDAGLGRGGVRASVTG